MFERVAVQLDGSQFGEMALPWAAHMQHVVSMRDFGPISRS